MKQISWKDIAELVGIGAVVVGLVFVGLQIRQERDIARAQLSEETRGSAITQVVAENAELWRRGLDGEELEPNDEVIYQNIAYSIHANYLEQYRRGFRIGGFEATRIAQNYAFYIYQYPGFRRFWRERLARNEFRNKAFDRQMFQLQASNAPNFIATVRQILADLDSRSPDVPPKRSYVHY